MTIFDFPSRLAWQSILFAACVAYGMLALLGVSIAVKPLLFLASVTCGLFGVAFVYTRWRPDPKLATCAMGAAWLLTMAASGGTMTYPLAAIGGALWDDRFVAFEQALGLDWQAAARALSAASWLQTLWQVTYESSLFQMAASVLLLSFLDRRERLGAYLKMLLLSLVVTNLLSALMPAIGPLRAYGIGDDIAGSLGDAGVRHLIDFFALREGRFTVFELYKMEGIITFPSFHCVLAVLTAWALWPVRWLGPIMAVFNALVLVSTIPQGGHYLADILSGSAIGLGALALHYASATRRVAQQPAAASATNAVHSAPVPG